MKTIIIIFSILLAVGLLTIGVQKVFANAPLGVPEEAAVPHSDTIPKSFEKKIEHPNKCQTLDGFSPVEKCGGGHHSIKHSITKHTDPVRQATLEPVITAPRVSLTYCNNTNTTGPFTDWVNSVGECDLLKVLFESPNSVMLQYSDLLIGANILPQHLEAAFHWYETSHQDDGTTTTIVLAPLR